MTSRWKIDDTSKPGRIFCEHTQDPKLLGELVSPDDLPDTGFTLPAPEGNWLLIIRWLGEIHSYEEQDMYDSLEVALKAHEAAK